jgi:hypothetical protein
VQGQGRARGVGCRLQLLRHVIVKPYPTVATRVTWSFENDDTGLTKKAPEPTTLLLQRFIARRANRFTSMTSSHLKL